MKIIISVLTLSLMAVKSEVYHPRNLNPGRGISKDIVEEENVDYWMKSAEEELKKAAEQTQNTNIAKNIIIFIGDGMSIPTVTAARIYKGQLNTGGDGNSASLSWESFPNVGLSKTYSINGLVPDSAATASAMFSGVKTVSFTMGYDSHIVEGDANSIVNATEVKTILDWAQEAGMATGIVTNTHVTHATPAALYAKTPDRGWECDKEMPPNNLTTDITAQLIDREVPARTDIILGGGRASFVPYYPVLNNTDRDFDYSIDYFDCARQDGRDLVLEWQIKHPEGVFVDSKNDLNNINADTHSKVLGLFGWGHMAYEDQLSPTTTVPTVKEMTENAIRYLKQKSSINGDKGFFLMVEGGKIDHAHHSSMATRSLNEVLGLDRAVEAALGLVDTQETLIIVTADHSHTFSFGGYPSRLADITRDVDTGNAKDGKPYTIMSYGNGPGFKDMTVNQTSEETGWESIIRKPSPGSSSEYEYVQNSPVPLSSESHGGDDVGIWAIGPLSHYFHSVHQQSYIAHVMSLSACIGPYSNHTRCPSATATSATSSNQPTTAPICLVLITFLLSLFRK